MRVARIGTQDSQLNQFLEALHKEADRGAALAAAAFAEDILGTILSSFLADVPESTELTDGFAAPISTFASKTKLAYVLGLLDKSLFDALNILRRIRNEFAHSWVPVSFETKNVQDLVTAFPSHPVYCGLPKPGNLREEFDAYVSTLLFELSLLPEVIRPEKRTPTRLLRAGKVHNTEAEADAEYEQYRRACVAPSKD